jgi:hypothetical protein
MVGPKVEIDYTSYFKHMLMMNKEWFKSHCHIQSISQSCWHVAIMFPFFLRTKQPAWSNLTKKIELEI